MFLLAALVIGSATPEIDCRDDFPTQCTSGLHAGDPAPFAGVLLTGDLAARLFLVEKNQNKRIAAAVKNAEDKAKVHLKHERALRKIDQDAFDEKLREIKEAHERDLMNVKPAWYEHPAFVIPVAVAATLGAVWLSVEVLEARR